MNKQMSVVHTGSGREAKKCEQTVNRFVALY